MHKKMWCVYTKGFFLNYKEESYIIFRKMFTTADNDIKQSKTALERQTYMILYDIFDF